VPQADVLLVSLGSTGGWRMSDPALAEAMRRAGATVALATAAPVPDVRTLMATDLRQARAARAAAVRGLAEAEPRAVLYSTTTAALLWPRPGAIRFDALAAANRPGRHGLWQRPLERRRLAAALLLVPLDAGALAEAGRPPGDAVVVPVPVEPSGPPAPERDVAALAYAPDPAKKGLALVLDAWRAARKPDETLVVVGRGAAAEPGVEVHAPMAPEAYRALLRRARVFVTAPVREDFGIAQLEALADGCLLVTTEAAGAYPAARLARALDPRLVGDDLAGALRHALDDPVPGYATRASALLEPFSPRAVDRTVAEDLLPRLLG
jgi:Glycosyl transferases group 1